MLINAYTVLDRATLDDLMANLQATFQFKPICGLFRAEVFLNQPLDFRLFIR
ncbi:MAG: hypothetical protein ABL869_02360 [Candidatus Nitrotoga sp.]